MNKAIVKEILLVEDEAIVAKVQIKQLQNYGYNVIHLLTGEAAVELLADGNTPVQLVLMDIDLGAGMDGTQAAQIILKKRDIPIVFLSSHTEPDVVEKTEKISSFGYVVKGSGITVLDASIKMAFKLHQARAEARARELHYRQMFEKNLSVKLIIDPVDGRIIEANQAACDFYGYDNRTITGMKITDINTLSEAEVHAEMQSARREDRLYFNFKHRMADGTIKDVEVYSSPMQRNERTLLYSIIHDITDRRRAEEDLKKFRMAIEQSPVSVVMTDPDGNINYVNPRFSEITGYAPEEVLGKNPRFQRSGLTPLEMYSDMWKTILSGETWQGEIVNRARDGRLYWEHILITPILDEEDRITSFLGIKENITHRKKSEEVLRISQEKLLDAQYMAHLGDFSWDLRTNEVTWSDGMYALMKFQRDENFDFAKINEQIHHPEDREWVEQWLGAALKSGLEYFPPQEYRLVRNDGKVIWVRTNIHVLYENEKPIFLNGICQDITERKATEQAIRRLLAEKETIIKETHHRIKNNV
ncbi:MAG: PAS domain S-box protein, partial [Leptospiraceae bacterium]|nr:PAS domain S-box protein [Leptospiraceae bacterium]